MMIPFENLVQKFHINAKGVLHIGANSGQEAMTYKKYGIDNVIWIEALPNVFGDLCKHLTEVDCCDENVICINACVGDEDGKQVMFHESNNESQSSSYLELGLHKGLHPTVSYIRDIPMTTYRVETLLKAHDMSRYNLLNIDVQGVELQVLKGMGDLLHGFKYAIIEINLQETYVNGALVGEVDDYMSKFDFVRAETGTWVGDCWTDGFYIKKWLL